MYNLEKDTVSSLVTRPKTLQKSRPSNPTDGSFVGFGWVKEVVICLQSVQLSEKVDEAAKPGVGP